MSENTKTQDRKPKAEYVRIVFAVLIVAVYFTGLSIPLLGPDEPRYAQVAREMFARGDWVTPTLGGFDWFEKPALLYWLQIVAYRIFGVGEFAARAGSALFGLGTVASLWLLGRRHEKDRRAAANDGGADAADADAADAGSFADRLALVAASSLGLIVFARGASFDIILTFPVTAALVSFFHFDRAEKGAPARLLPLFGFYFFIGVALIAKGLVGAVFPLAIVAFYYLLSRRMPPRSFVVSLFWGALVSLAAAAAWYLPMYRANGWKFIDEFFIQHHFQRYTSNKYLHPQPFYFFFWVLPLMTLPWLPFFAAALWKMVRPLFARRRQAESADAAEAVYRSPLALFAAAWMMVPLAFFSVSGSKLPGYILPALPAAIVLAALAADLFARRSAARRRALAALAALVLVGAALAAQFFIAPFLHEETVRHLVATADAAGYGDRKILSLHTISHSAEFYGAGRLLRDPDGRQKRLYGASEVVAELAREKDREALVLVPLVYLSQLTKSEALDARPLDDNGELAIVWVKLK